MGIHANQTRHGERRQRHCRDHPAGRPADALAYWMGPDKETFVAEVEGEVVGTYYLRPNQQAVAAMSATADI
jgi:hypothetical protein